jgi:aryl-alcohol dehydrogenase-like predicted oxidoreductase
MLHQEGLLSRWHEGLGDILKGFVASGKVGRVGVSVYSPDKALEALGIDGMDIIQVPSNILDRRFEKHGIFELARQKRKQVYIRSVFLQGLILMNLEDIPSGISSAIPILGKINALASEFGLTRQELALGYLKTRMPEAKLIIGVDTTQQVMVNTTAWRKDYPAILQARVAETFDLVDEKILNPALWR